MIYIYIYIIPPNGWGCLNPYSALFFFSPSFGSDGTEIQLRALVDATGRLAFSILKDEVFLGRCSRLCPGQANAPQQCAASESISKQKYSAHLPLRIQQPILFHGRRFVIVHLQLLDLWDRMLRSQHRVCCAFELECYILYTISNDGTRIIRLQSNCRR